MRVVQRLGAVAVDAQDRYASSIVLVLNLTRIALLFLSSPREDVKIHKARIV